MYNLSDYKIHVLYKGHVFHKSVLMALVSHVPRGIIVVLDTYTNRVVVSLTNAHFTTYDSA